MKHLILTLFILALIPTVLAYNDDWVNNPSGNPAVFGHSVDEVDGLASILSGVELQVGDDGATFISKAPTLVYISAIVYWEESTTNHRAYLSVKNHGVEIGRIYFSHEGDGIGIRGVMKQTITDSFQATPNDDDEIHITTDVEVEEQWAAGNIGVESVRAIARGAPQGFGITSGYATGGRAPDYESAWVADTQAWHTTTFNHNLGEFPVQVEIYFRPTLDSEFIIPVSLQNENINPGTVRFTESEIQIDITASWSLGGQWNTVNGGWLNTWSTGYWKVYAWKKGATISFQGDCIYAETAVGETDNEFHEVPLTVNGENICMVPHGCHMLTYRVHDTDGSLNIVGDGYFLQTASGLYRETVGAESEDINGDGRRDLFLNDDNCDYFDDEPGVEVSPDSIVMRDQVSAEKCAISICPR